MDQASDGLGRQAFASDSTVLAAAGLALQHLAVMLCPRTHAQQMRDVRGKAEQERGTGSGPAEHSSGTISPVYLAKLARCKTVPISPPPKFVGLRCTRCCVRARVL